MRASHEHAQGQHGGHGHGDAASASSGPGKRTLTEQLPGSGGPGGAASPGGAPGGEALPDAPRAKFEQSLGRDLSGVRVHTDDAAAGEADRVGARAYASGQDIMFARGEYNPFDARSMHLLAHEVAHTAQQQGASAGGELSTTQPGDAAERNADTAAAAMLAGRPAAVSAQPMAIARKMRDESIDVPSVSDGGNAGAPGAGGGEGAPGEAKAGEQDEEIGELSAERVGQEPDEGEDVGPDVPVRDVEGGKQEIAARGQELPPQGGAEEIAGGVAPEAGGGGVEAGGGGGEGGEGGGAVSAELTTAVTEAQNDAREAITQSEAESATYKAEMAERRDRFEAEQNATMIEQLRTMSAVEKRQTLQEMGYDPKKVKKLKDAELDGLIEGKVAAEQRKTKILGMTPEELAGLSAGQKLQFLVDLGIDRKDLDKAGPDKTTRLFDDVMKVAHVPGQHKVKIKIKGGLLGKSWEVKVKVDAEGNTDLSAEKKGGFLSKLWGWVKAALPIILTVLAPLTAGASLIVLGIYQAAMAIKNGDWLGAVLGAVTAIGGLSTLVTVAKGASAAATTLSKVADVAKKVQKVAQTAQAAMAAAKAKNAGSLLGALAQGASAFAAFSSDAASKFAQTMTRWSERLKKWSAIISGGEKVVQGIKKGDPLVAVGGAFDAAAAVVGAKTPVGKGLERASKITGYVSAGKKALEAKPPNYAQVAEAALGIANQLKEDRRIEDASRIITRADKLKQAWDRRETDPGALAEAALGLAEAIQLAKYDLENEEKKGADGKPLPDAERTEITDRYKRAGRIVTSASNVMKAAMTRPRPNYLGALDAATQLIAELTDSKQIDAAAVVTSRLDAFTRAVNSKDAKAIAEAGVALARAIDGMRDVITGEHDKARSDAQAQLPAGETLPEDDVGTLPPGPSEDESFTPMIVPASYDPSSGGIGGPYDDGNSYFVDPQPERGGPRVSETEPAAEPAPAQTPAAADTRELSGASWCDKYPTGTTIAELTDSDFRTAVQAFNDAMVAAATADNKLGIDIEATFRPVERAHLMHYCVKVRDGSVSPADANTASAAAGITINWDHGKLETSKAKAGEMARKYNIAYPAALKGRHTEGKAIDWSISWTGSLLIAEKGKTDKLDCTGSGVSSKNLHKVGASYGVHKLVGDDPHWSSDGK